MHVSLTSKHRYLGQKYRIASFNFLKVIKTIKTTQNSSAHIHSLQVMTTDVQARKRPYEDVVDNLERSTGTPPEDDFDIETMLTQGSGLHNPRKREKLQRRVLLTQATQAKTQAHRENVDSHACGYIKSVTLKNFMCHENFQINLGRRLNFIIGHNGSGKSAILTAISICLGAKATDTNRGSSLKDLIKEGKHSSQVQVVLANDGYDAFEPGKYGKEIIIERTIKRDSAGSAPYILRSESGKKISSKKADLDAVLDNFNISVNNPMAFLSQDAARSFLTASNDEQKYKFFMKGTMMDQIEDNLKSSKTQVQKLDTQLITMKRSVIQLRDAAKEAKALLDVLYSSNDLRERQTVLYATYFYMEADLVKKKIEEFNSSQADYKAAIDEIQRQIEQNEREIDEIETENERAQEKLRALNQQLEEARANVKSCEKNFGFFVGKGESELDSINDQNRDIEKCQKKIAKTEIAIREEEARLKQIHGGSKDLLQEQLVSLQTTQSSLEEELSRHQAEMAALSEKQKESYNRLQAEEDNLREEIQQMDGVIRESQKNHNNPLQFFPNNYQQALNEMKKVRFDAAPLGPLGIEISIKPEYERWSQLINAAFSKDATTFIVHSFNDQKRLQEILRKVHCFATVLIRRSERFDYTRGQADKNFTTVLDALYFKNEEAMYTLIDLKHIESILLVEDRKDAQHILEEIRPSNVTAILSLNDRRSGIMSSIGVNGGFRTNPVNYEMNNPKILPQSGNSDVSGLRSQLNEIHSSLKEAQAQKSQLKRQSDDEKASLRNTIKDLEAKLRTVKKQVYGLQRKLDEDGETGTLDALRDELDDSKRELEVFINTVPELQRNLQEYKSKAEEANASLDDARKIYDESYNFIKQLIEFSKECESSQQYKRTTMNTLHNSKLKRERELQLLEDTRPGLEANLEDNLKEAGGYATREQTETIQCSSRDELQEMIERINEEVENANSKLSKSPDEIIREDEYASSKYEEARHQLEEIESSRRELNHAIFIRTNAFQESRDLICFTADVDFKSSLQFRNFSGNLGFDFFKKKLQMLVSTKNDKKPRHVDSLSGGEKSFSQIALLLATWKPMRSRIKGLDEFDVFMDQVNRKIGMRLMLKKLSEEYDSQTIFITPQDIGQISEMDDNLVTIYRMRDPRGNN